MAWSKSRPPAAASIRRVNKVFRSRHCRGLVHGAIVLLLVHVAGTLGYHWLGRPTAGWIDSFYMNFITGPATLARLHDPRNADKARRVGADEIVSPDFTGGVGIAAAMLRPHVVTFMEQMLRSEEGLRLEEAAVPAGHVPAPLVALRPRSRDYILVATHEEGRWVFNPGTNTPCVPARCSC
jgi:hypothetical protein